MVHFRVNAIALAAATAFSWVVAAAAGVAIDEAPNTILRTLQERLPEVRIIDVRPSAIDGLYEVYAADGILYSDSTGDHVFVGNLMDTRSRRNLTVDRMDERNAIDFASLPFDRAIKIVKGTGSRKLAVFADPDCPFCQKLERELAAFSDATLYIFLLPLAQLHPDAPVKARNIWCAADPALAWSEWMLEKKLPAEAGCANDPVAELSLLAKALRIGSTPTIFLESGRRIAGAVPISELEKAMTARAPAVAAGAAPRHAPVRIPD